MHGHAHRLWEEVGEVASFAGPFPQGVLEMHLEIAYGARANSFRRHHVPNRRRERRFDDFEIGVKRKRLIIENSLVFVFVLFFRRKQ